MSGRNRAAGSTTQPGNTDQRKRQAMTQMPYPPQGYPAPQQPYPPQYPAQPMPQAYPQQPMAPYQAFLPQGQPQAPAAPVVTGSMDDFYNQPTAAGGPGISWKDKALGTTYRGIISGKCTVQQDVDYDTKQPKFQRDGVTPKWVMQIPLSQVQTNHPGQAEFPDGEAVFYVRGLAKDELARAMAEANCSGEPQAGATFQVTLTNRKPQRKGNPANVVQIAYVPPGGVPHNEAPAQPVQQEQAPAPSLPPVQQAQGPVGVNLPSIQQQQAPAPLAPMGQSPVAEQAAPPQWAQPQAEAAPVVSTATGQPVVHQQSLPPQPPAGLDANQQALLQQLGAGQAQG